MSATRSNHRQEGISTHKTLLYHKQKCSIFTINWVFHPISKRGIYLIDLSVSSSLLAALRDSAKWRKVEKFQTIFGLSKSSHKTAKSTCQLPNNMMITGWVNHLKQYTLQAIIIVKKLRVYRKKIATKKSKKFEVKFKKCTNNHLCLSSV